MKNQLIIQKLMDLNITFGSVESFTGGQFASTVVNYPGVSKVYKGSIVSYSNDVKHRVLKIKESDLKKYGAVSSTVALEMARNGKKILDVDFCVAFTGNAGPTATNYDVGEVFIALIYGEDEILEHFKIKGDRNKVRSEAVTRAFQILERVLENYN
ncbi:MAG: CinA family protein [Bacilli bacterium]|nr:CinA family protein [Bacilli bacterium]